MFRKFLSHHSRAERSLDTVVNLLASAREAVEEASKHNELAREAHRVAIEVHSDGLATVKRRAEEISRLVEKTHA